MTRHAADLRLIAGMLACIGALAFGCDRLYGPVVYNETGADLVLRVEWRDGSTDQTTIAADGILHVGRPDSEVHEIELWRGGVPVE